MTDLLASNLDIDRKWLANRFEAAKYEAQYESIVIKELASPLDVAWVEAHQFEYPETPGRSFQPGERFQARRHHRQIRNRTHLQRNPDGQGRRTPRVG
jgi:hypothetical protein